MAHECQFMPYPTPLHDAAGNLVGAVNMLVDLSERSHAEQIKAIARLYRRVL